MKNQNTSLNLVTLGCSKNLVDSEKLLRQLKENGYSISHNSPGYSDIVIINTCGFILDAKNESVETILSYADAKKKGFVRKLIVTGCLSQRYENALKREIPEVDAFFGVNREKELLQVLGGSYHAGLLNHRILSTPSHYAYLKVSEGCNRNCSFCAIPLIRGKHVSFPLDDLVQEAELLASSGVKEIILIAQDLTSYGTDRYKQKELSGLIRKLEEIRGLEWIRLHYIYPQGFPVDEIIRIMKNSEKVCRYLDIPIQHINDRILKEMNRGHGRIEIESLIDKFRTELPEAALRTTIITGFPGETDEEFDELYQYIGAVRFDRLGVFTYSEEEGTSAAREKTDSVDEQVKEERKKRILELQEGISLEKNYSRIGEICKVLIDRIEGEFLVGRTEFDSPEVDNEVLINKGSSGLKPGDFCSVEITTAEEFDLYGLLMDNNK